MKELNSKLVAIQSDLNAPKSQRNTFAKYDYRSCEDILKAVKPLLKKHDLILLLSDEIFEAGDRVYVKATAKISNEKDFLSTTAFAREPESQAGMSASQMTGCASSYARKYALNGLFAIDDTKDADTDEHKHQTTSTNKPASTPSPQPAPQKPQQKAQEEQGSGQDKYVTMLVEMFGEDYGGELANMTAWEKNGKVIPGRSTLNGMSQAQTPVVHGKIKKAYEAFKATQGDMFDEEPPAIEDVPDF